MPALGAGMDAGKVVEWYVHPGDVVTRGQIVALVETDKANIDVEVFESGRVEELLVAEGTKVPVGTPLAVIAPVTAGVTAGVEAGPAGAGVGAEEAGAVAAGAAAEAGVAVAAGAGAGAGAEEAETAVAREPAEVVGATVAPGPGGVPEPAGAPEAPGPAEAPVAPEPDVQSPLVRLHARALGVDLARVQGTGPCGIITRQDVTRAAMGGVAAGSVLTRVGAGVSSSPYARRLASERRVDLVGIGGSGPAGAVVASDVPPAGAAAEPHRPPAPAGEEARPAAPAEQPRPPAPAGEVRPSAPGGPPPPAAPVEDRTLAMRLAIARAMERANREIPHYHLGETVDVEDTLRWLSERNADRPPAERILPAALLLKAVALACVRYPEMNGYWIDDAFQPGEGVHLGVAINLRRGGLLAPAIRDADALELDELMAALRDLVQRTRSGGLRGSELTDPTITVSNLGDTGVETIHGVITPPQVALVGAGRILERPWAVDGMLAVRRTIFLSLAADHRASDGHRGGLFLACIAENLRRPETL